MVVGSLSRSCQVVVIGAGPGGYLAAIRLAQLGNDVLLVDERAAPGGVCLNEGCIPSKALIHAAHLLEQIRRAPALGIATGGEPSVDLSKLVAWKDGVVERLTSGVRTLVERNGGELLRGRARFSAPHELEVEGDDGIQRIDFERAVIATGSRPIELPQLPFDGQRVISSREALSPTRIPERLLVVGGGYIGLELGAVYRRLGARVSVVEQLDALLPDLDPEIGRLLTRSLEREGVTLRLGQAAGGLREADPLRVALVDETGDRTDTIEVHTIEADQVLVCVGRRPNSDRLGLAEAGVQLDERGYIVVDEQLRTSAPGVFAIGDVIAGPPLAHRAYREAHVVAEVISGQPSAFDNRAIPAVIYTDPEVAWVGLTEKQAREAGHRVRTGTFPLRASGRALTLDATEGLVKVVTDADSELLLGVQIVGPNAGELVAEPTLALEMGAFSDDLSQTIHAHPTLAESLHEAVLSALGRATHVLQKNRRR